MNIHFQSIEVHSSFLTKAFRIHGIIEYYREIEAPFQISGVVKTDDGLVISILQEAEIQQPTDMHLVSHKKDIEDKIYGSANLYKNHHQIQFIAPVTQECIQHIELLRQSCPDQSVKLHINYAIKYLVAQHQKKNRLNDSVPLINLMTNSYYSPVNIPQSDWINRFASQLQIGEFILVKLEWNASDTLPDLWKELHKRLAARLKEMTENRKKANWNGVIWEGRKFYELLKFNEKKKGSFEFLDSLKELLKNEQQAEESIQEFQKGIYHLFQYISKFAHEKDWNDYLKVDLIPTQEEAEMVYLMAIGLYNLFVQKISKLR